MDTLHEEVMCATKVFEVCAQGFDGSSDETDGHVFWVSAVSAEVVLAAIKDTGATLLHELPEVFDADVDFRLPAQAMGFSSALLEKASEARNWSRVVPKG